MRSKSNRLTSARRMNRSRRGGGKLRRLAIETLEDRRLLSTIPFGDESRVNQLTSGTQQTWAAGGAVAIMPGGDYVIAFSGQGPGDSNGVFAQRFAAGGTQVGNEFRLNSNAIHTQQNASVALAPNGDVVAVWGGAGQGDLSGVFMQRFAEDGSRLGGEQRVNDSALGTQERPVIAMGEDGRYVVAWSGRGAGDSSGVFLRRFDAQGRALGKEIRGNTTTAGTQQQPALAMLPGGGFVAAWSGRGPGDTSGIFVRRFDASGIPIGGEKLVNTTTAGTQQIPSVAVDGRGQFSVAWSGSGPGDSSGIFLQQFSANGARLGAQRRVNTLTPNVQSAPAIAMASGGELIVVWDSLTQQHGSPSASTSTIEGQQFDAAGQPVGDQFRVNSTTAGAHRFPAIAMDRHGSVVVAWSGQGLGDSQGVFARRFASTVDTIPPVILASLAHDTGSSTSDEITSDPTVSGRITDASRIAGLRAGFDNAEGASFLDVSAGLLPDGTFTLDRNLLAHVFGATLSDGQHALHLQAADAAGNVSSFGIFFTLDTTVPAAPAFDLSAASDIISISQHTTSAGRVTLVGRTEPGSTVALLGTGLSALSSNQGAFAFNGISLQVGSNAFTARATDRAGNSADFQRSIERVQQTNQQDPVLRWNQAAIEAIRQDGSNPPYATRALAMVHAAILDAVNAVEGKPGYYVSLNAPAGTSAEAAIDAAANRVLSELYPAQQSTFDELMADLLTHVPAGQGKTDGVVLGQSVAGTIIALRSHDGFNDFVDYVPRNGPGLWQPTGPMFDVAQTPQWADVEPFVLTRPDQFRPAGPPALSSQAWTDAFNEVKSLGSATSTSRTADQTEIARFWADGAGTYTPPGHWNQITESVALSQGNSLAENARLFAELNLALADAAIAGWDVKYHDNFWRPITAINQADTDGNPYTAPDSAWTSLLITPPFPEYVSGHGTFSATAATVLAANFGDNLSFDTTSIGLPGVTRSFTSFGAAAEEAGRSRVYGGIHFQFSNLDGQTTGRNLANYVLDTFSVSADTRPPTILIENPESGKIVSQNFAVAGRVLDNLSGVTSLAVQLDGGAFADLPFDASGHFTLTTALPLDGSADATHVLRFRGADAAGNFSPLVAFSFALDVRAPAITVDTPLDASNIDAATLLSGQADGTGSSITRLTYRLDTGAVMPIVFDQATGRFSQPLDLSHLAAGPHALAVTARDAAGHETTLTRSVNLPAAIPFAVRAFTPLGGANDVGSTYRPQVFFSRPADSASLTANNFFATGPSGTKLPANIVTAGDGSFAWLFFTGPMPGASKITVHVDGSTIRAAADGALLDADGGGSAPGMLEYSFTTVSLSPLLGTTLSGKVVDPGPDLKLMTFDDIRAGADGVLHTADDVFLLPIAGVRVFIVGLENQAVLTDAAGNFSFDAVPSGDVKLALDGRTAINAPPGSFFPEMVIDLNLEAGRANTAMGAMGTRAERAVNSDRKEIYLPRLQTSILHTVSNTLPTTIGAGVESAPNLTPEQRAMLTIEVQPGSLLDQSGNPLATGQVGISTVPPELVRDMLPPGLLQHTFDITVQAPGITNFSTPAPMTFPNVFNAPPGTQLNLLSFDHTTGRLVIEGTATVSADGLSVHTDPGTGITHPGWHGMTPPGAPAGPEGPPPLAAIPDQSAPIIHDPVALPLITQESGGVLAHDNLTWSPPAEGTLTVTIEVDGPLGDFMKRAGAGNLPLDSQTFTLTSGKGGKKSLVAASKDYAELLGKDGFATISGDRLYGAMIRTTETLTRANVTTTEIRTFYLYRWVSAVFSPDATARRGNTAAFQKTLNDGPLNWSTTKSVEAFLPSTVTTDFSAAAATDQVFKVEGAAQGEQLLVWRFDPIAAGAVQRPITIKVSDRDLVVGELNARGTGISPTKIDLNAVGYRDELKRVLVDLVEAWRPGSDGGPGKAGVDDDGNGTTDDFSEYGWLGSDDAQGVYYRFSRTNPTVIPGLSLMDLRGPAARLGLTGTVKEFVIDTNNFFGVSAGDDRIPGNADDVRYRKATPVSFVAQDEFFGFMPSDRADAGPDGILTTYDDLFTADQRAALEVVLDGKVLEMRQAVEADYRPVDEGKGAYVFVNSGGDLTLTWTDVFMAPGREIVKGISGSGAPIYGFANSLDADRFNDLNGDGIVLDTVLSEVDIPLAAKTWALVEELNVKPQNEGTFGVAINMGFKSKATFAQFVANTVSHELGHTFGLIDAYVRPLGGLPGDVQADADGNAIPFDIMRGGLDSDADLTFLPSNVQLLRAAMGIAPEGNVGDGVRQYRHTFNLPDSPFGIRENTPPPEEDSPPADAVLVAVTDDGFWYGGLQGMPLELGETPADGAGGQSQFVGVGVHNAGGSPLDVSAIRLVNGATGFALEDTTGALGDSIAPGDTVEFFVRFDPLTAGIAEDVIEIVSDAPGQPIVRVPLAGGGVTNDPTADVKLTGGGNLGGVLLGSGRTTTSFATVTNAGREPLLVRGVRLVDGSSSFKLLDVPSDLAANPISLAHGATFLFGVRFDPARLGLDRAAFEITTNDVAHPTLRFTVSGTGISPIPRAIWGNDYVSLVTPDNGGSPLRVRSDDQGHFDLFLPLSRFYELTVFDPQTGLIGRETGVTTASGQRTTLGSTLVIGASTAPDTDFDGLPDDIERAIGTSTTRADSDGNGLDDFAEIQQGRDPLGGRPAVTGILAQVSLRGESRHIAVEGATAQSPTELAYVATGSFGLAIVNVSEFAKPVVWSELDLPGNATDIAVDAGLQLAAVATGATGIQVVDVSDPRNPRLVRTIDVAANQIEVSSGIAYVGVGTSIQAYDLVTGNQIGDVSVSGNVGGLARDGSFLYATDSSSVLTTMELTGRSLTRRGQLAVSPSLHRGQLFVGGGVAYLLNSFVAGGYATVDVSNPDLPVLISGVDFPANGATIPGNGVVADGSGTGLLVGTFVDFINGRTLSLLDLLDASDPNNTFQLLQSILLPTEPLGVTSAGGAAYIADGTGGLIVANYLPFDVEGKAPSLSILPDDTIDPATGIRTVAQGATVRLRIAVQDDVKVRGVEVLLDDPAAADPLSVLRSDVSFPYNLEFPGFAVRPRDNGVRTTLVRVRVTDTSGNVSISEPIPIRTVKETGGPVFLRGGFLNGALRADGLTKLALLFSEPLAPATVNGQTFRVLDVQNQPIAGLAVTTSYGNRTVEVCFDALAAGSYSLVIDASRVTDVSDNPMGDAPDVTQFNVTAGPIPHEFLAGRLTFTGARMTVGQLRAVGDFNGDGNLDIVIPRGDTGGPIPDVGLLLGRGDGSFDISPASPTPGSVIATQPIAADFNNDGLLDVASPSRFENLVRIGLGNGDGTFRAPPSQTQITAPSTLTVGDFNRDGNLDLIVGGAGRAPNTAVLDPASGVGILLGRGDGTFDYQLTATYNLGLNHTSLTAADMDGDGALDLVATDFTNNAVSILKGLGNGNFLRDSSNTPLPVTKAVPGGVKLAAVADLNGDGRMDVAVTGVNRVSVLLGNGDGSLQAPVAYVASDVYDIMAVDINNDGRLDLVANNPGVDQTFPGGDPGNLYVLINQGSGHFANAVTIAAAAAPTHLASGDFNHDGRPDVLVTSDTQGVSVFAGDGAGSLVTARRYDTGRVSDPTIIGSRAIDVIRTADLNGDGVSDVIFTERAGFLYTRLGNGDGTFRPLVSIPIDTLAVPTEIAFGDINGDKKLDIATANNRSDTVDILLGNGDGTFQLSVSLNFSPGGGFIRETNDVAFADLNLDGNLDLVVGFAGAAQVAILRGLGSGAFEPITPRTFLSIPTTSFQVEVADFNGDGNLDLATLQPMIFSPGDSPLNILLGRGDGTFLAPVRYFTAPASRSMTVADVNGDCILDLVTSADWLSATAGGSIGVLQGVGDGTFLPAVRYGQYRWGYFAVTTADVNDDGHLDLVASGASGLSSGQLGTGLSRGVAVLLNNRDGTFGAPTFYDHAGRGLAGISTGDFNGDFLPDILTANFDDDTFSIIYGQRTVSGPLLFGNSLQSLASPSAATSEDGAEFDWLIKANAGNNRELLHDEALRTLLLTLPASGETEAVLNLSPNSLIART